MKQIVKLTAAVAAAILITASQAANTPPGFVDFGKFEATPGTEFVEVNISSNLVALVTSLAKDEPEIVDMLKGLQSIRVNVLGVTAANRADIESRIQSVRAQLSGGGWERVVTVLKDKEDVGVYMKMRGPEAVEGLVVTVIDGSGRAVLVNVVGDIRPEKLTTLGERFDIEPLKNLPGKPSKQAKLD